MKHIYLDHAATTATAPEVVEAMLPYFSEHYANPSSIYGFSRPARAAIESARAEIAELIGASSREIVFTSGGSESDNFAIKGVAFAKAHKGKHIITSAIEHHAVLEPCAFLKHIGYDVSYIPVDAYGIVDPDDVRRAIRPDTILISVMHANNEIGSLQPIGAIGEIAREHGVIFHCDAVQTFGHLPVDVEALNVDLLSASAHKLYGPKGIGMLYVRKGTPIKSLIHGGDQERKRRASTENTPGIVGFGKAVEMAKGEMADEAHRLAQLRDAFIKGISDHVPDALLNGHPTRRLPNNINFSFEGLEGESILLTLDMEGISVSTGSACTSSTLAASHVMLALDRSHELAHGSIRFSMGKATTQADMEYVLEVVIRSVERLRKMSPLYKK